MTYFETRARAAIASAVDHLGKGRMPTSARLCLENAMGCLNLGGCKHIGSNPEAHEEARELFQDAIYYAVRSIRYSVGIFHPDYQRFA